jgi:Uma2 family endonuclease
MLFRLERSSTIFRLQHHPHTVRQRFGLPCQGLHFYILWSAPSGSLELFDPGEHQHLPIRATMYNQRMAREQPVRTATSFEEFLKFERSSPVRHEFIDGNLFVMAGGTDRNNQLAIRVLTRVSLAVEGSDCVVYMADMLVRTPSNVGYYYPDVFASHEAVDGSRVKHQPCFIAEVLSEPAHEYGASESTEAIDRGEKLLNYAQFEHLETYVLISQVMPQAGVYSRQPDGSWRYEVIKSGGVLRVPCIKLELPLEILYANL